MTDGGFTSHCPDGFRDADLVDAFAAGRGAERADNAAFLDAFADRLRVAGDDDRSPAVLIAGLATTIRAGLAEGDPQSTKDDS